MTDPLAILILAAGKGTRMKSDSPKVMHMLAGRPMINWLLDACEALNPDKIVVVTGPDMADLQAAVKPHKAVVQEIRDGTGGAVKCALPALKGFKGNVLILLGDTPLLNKKTLKALIAAKDKNALSILGCTMPNPFGYGRLILDDKGNLKTIVEEKDANSQQKSVTLVNTGAFCADGAQLEKWIAKLDTNNAQNELYITQLPSIIAKEGGKTAVATISDADEILGCNTHADLAALEKTLQNRLRKSHMDAGVSMQDPETVYLWHDTKIASSAHLEPNIFFGPDVKIAERVTIKAFSHLEGAHVKSGATIGPFARLRPGTVLSEDVRIGNFVEVKNSSLGKGSKANHLGYIGDAALGENVNFSCGAITVNYDGFEKHKTIIGDSVMVGSNASLIAPIKIGDGAFVAAGSTLTENVPADALAMTRPDTQIKKGWAAKYREIKAAIKRKKSA